MIACLVCIGSQVNAQTEQRYNRFQYYKFHWRSFHTKTFHIYFPQACDSLCAFVSKAYPEAQEYVKHAMTGSLKKPPTIIIYPSIDQAYESNIGSFEPKEYTLPTFVSKGSRLLLFFNGSYADLLEQLKEGLARSVWETQLQSEGVAGQVKGAGKDDPIPMWFKEGSIKYFADGWPIIAEDVLRRSFEDNNFYSWQDVINYQPGLSGQAFCYFLSDRYYKQAVPALFFQLKKKKQLPRAIRLVTKMPMDSLFAECFHYYKGRFRTSIVDNRMAKANAIMVPHTKGIIKTVLISADKRNVAYILNTYKKRTVYCYNTQAHTTSKLCAYLLPPWIGDHSADIYPIIGWSEKGNTLLVTEPVKGKLTIRDINLDGTERYGTKLYGIDGVSRLTQEDYRQFLLSAYRRGQDDIVLYDDNKERYTPITNDIYDDSYPVNDAQKRELIFVSKRPLFERMQGLYTFKNKEIVPFKVDSIDYVKWDKPTILINGRTLATHTIYGTEHFALVGENSIRTLSQYRPFQYLPSTNEMVFSRDERDTILVQTVPLENWLTENTTHPEDTLSPWLKDYRMRQAEAAKEDSIIKHAKNNNPALLDGVFHSPTAASKAKQVRDSIQRTEQYDSKKISPYILELHSAYFTAQVNNDYFINRYQPYLNYQGQFKFPEVGGMLQGGIADLFENHHFKISYRLPAGSEGSDFFIQYNNTARKVDWGLTYFRKVESLKPDPNRNWVDEFGRQYPGTAKVKSFYYDVSIHYPLSYDCSLGLVEAVRNDRTIFLATNKYSLEFEDIKSVWSITTLSGELNKLRPTLPNLFKGFKGNAAVDVFKGFSQEETLVFGSTVHLQYHLPTYRYITLVLQGQGGYSVGDQKVLYTLGGVDNNVTPKVDSTVRFSQTAPYAFQSLVTPFRGYLQNSTYGNRYALFSADVYFPIFQTLIPIETPLPSINNLQLGIFSDAASAKETWTANPNNGKWLSSYGLSARTSLAGYPLRFDIAWPGSFSKRPIWYLSLNLK